MKYKDIGKVVDIRNTIESLDMFVNGTNKDARFDASITLTWGTSSTAFVIEGKHKEIILLCFEKIRADYVDALAKLGVEL